MKTLYFDCFAGASGDMILGAMIAAGVEPQDSLSTLPFNVGVIHWFQPLSMGISSTYPGSILPNAHRHLSDI